MLDVSYAAAPLLAAAYTAVLLPRINVFIFFSEGQESILHRTLDPSSFPGDLTSSQTIPSIGRGALAEPLLTLRSGSSNWARPILRRSITSLVLTSS